MPSCLSCGEDNPQRARFCLNCGEPIAGDPVREVRKTVTIVFTDVVGSTGLGERLDPETLRHVITRYYEVANAVLTRHGGRVQKYIGDAVMAIFGVPVLHEDDALRAVRAAVELHATMAERNAELNRDFGVHIDLRTGVNTGEVLVGEAIGGQDITLGNVTNVAARLEQIANPGEVLLGDDTYRLVRDAVTAELLAPLALKGKGAPVEAWRLLAVKPGAAGHARALDAPMIGRERELTLLLQAFDRVVADRAAHLVTLLGMAGAGKSRMLQELLARATGKATVLRGRCLDYGDGMTYWPLAEVIRQAVGSSPTDDPADVRRRITALFPPDEPPSVVDSLGALLGDTAVGADVEEVHLGLYRLLSVLAARRPLILVLDDLQWARETLLDLVEALSEWLRGIPVLLCCLARPELLEIRPTWGGGRVNATTLLLEPLPHDECAALLDNLLGNVGGAAAARDRVIDAAGGNPLYIEELVGMLIEDGLLARVGDTWVTTADLSRLEVPPTIAALLAARVDGLPAGERGVLERASVIGTVFHRGAVVALSPPEERRHVTGYLLNLVRKELIRPDPSAMLGESALHFRHLPLRDAAYRSLSKRERADLHERCAAWLEETFADRVTEMDEVIGYHLEQACKYRTGLGPVDETTAGLARRAAERLVASGRRAFGRRDMPGAVNLLGRGTALLPPGDPVRLAALPDLAAGLVEMGEFTGADRVLKEAVTGATQRADEALLAATQRVRAVLRLLVDPADAPVAGGPAAPEGEAGAGWTLMRDVRWLPQVRPGEPGRTGTSRSLGDVVGTQSATIGAFAMTAVLGAAPVRTTIERYAAYLRQPQPSRTLTVRVTAALAGLTAMDGRFDDARAHLASARSILEQLGLRVRAVALAYVAGLIELLADQPAVAADQLRRACEDCGRMGERYVLSNLLALRAQATYALGRHVEAVQLAESVEEVGPADDVVSRVTARGARAKALARLDYGGQAEPLAREAVAAAERTGLLNVHADALRDLAEVLDGIGDDAGATGAATAALALYRQKGNVVSAARMTAVLGRLPKRT